MKRSLLGLVLTGICGSVCAADLLGFTPSEGIGYFAEKDTYIYDDPVTGRQWEGKVRKAPGRSNARVLELYTVSDVYEPGIFWVLTTNLRRGEQWGTDKKSWMQKIRVDCQRRMIRLEQTFFFPDYLGKGTINPMKDVKPGRLGWVPLQKDTVRYKGAELACVMAGYGLFD